MPKTLQFTRFLLVIILLLRCGTSAPQDAHAKEPSISPPVETDPQRALDLNQKRGVSLLSLSEKASGLGLNLGLSPNSFGELILGGDWRRPTSRSAELQLGISLGAHIQLIQARDDAMLTFGTRFRVEYSEICEVEASLCADRSAISPLTPQYSVELPLRVYWFPNKYISIHSELGTKIAWGTAGATEGITALSGAQVILFSQSSLSSQLGLTLWF